MLNGPRAAVLGRPVAHSLSPILHRAAYDALGLSDWTFDLFDVGAQELPGFLASLDERWRGLALTMPLKEAALALADVASPTALHTGAANTLIRQDDSWHADNTDVLGIRAALLDAGVAPGAGRALVLGSGATARSALAALAGLDLHDVVLAVRGEARPETLRQAREAGMTIRVAPLDDAAHLLTQVPVAVSTLPPGGADAVAATLGERQLTGDGVLLDVVYAGWPTPLGTAARRAGLSVVPGIEMLIHQAAAQVRSMTGRDAPLAAMQAAGRAAQRTQGA
ncbi:shikimate dehydrogenase [Allobranchiibius huperziae]|uniref:shikimate dehydrogenase n=1 Tax=Allobranchiibius huperziae TaxID=1874116 RepID=UPI0031B62163